MGEYLSFKKLITPLLIQVVFWIAVLGNTIQALFYSSSFFEGLLLFILGPILIRIFCEGLIVIFEINNTLTEIRDNQIVASTLPPTVPPVISPPRPWSKAMQKFTRLTGTAAPLPMINIDTDMIIPKQFLKTITRSGLGRSLFFEMRYDDEGAERPDFVLNTREYRQAQILVAGDNFGCGSSREHAPWALQDFGIRAVIAPSFADIFFGNCTKNGMLPIVLPQAQIDTLMADAAGDNTRVLTIDLPSQRVIRANGESFSFEIDPTSKQQLVEGLDEIGQTMQRGAEIASFEQTQRLSQPWLWSKGAAA